MPKGVYERPGPLSYSALHKRLRKTRGNAREHTCPCGQQAHEWAYQGSAKEQADPRGRYKWSDDLMAYTAMCRNCHRHLDKGTRTHCARGHEFAGLNLKIEGGKRRCRTCHREAARRRRVVLGRAA